MSHRRFWRDRRAFLQQATVFQLQQRQRFADNLCRLLSTGHRRADDFGVRTTIGTEPTAAITDRSVYMCRVLPKLMPLWVAPLFEPYCSEMTVWPARSCSSLNWRSFLSASFGPIEGLPYLAILRPSDCRQMTTELRFCRSHRSTLWNVSCGGTPNLIAASRKAEMFSMHLNAILLLLTFFTVPASIALTSVQSTVPSFSTSKKLSISPDVLIGSPVTSLIHSRHSAASSSLYFEFICKRRG
uniref:Uncharacterized protein n=1 Tax=Anopheles atroparvus TaxID=41427 RepID=A0A182J6J0_ANOAO